MKTSSIAVWILGLISFSWATDISQVLKTGSIEHLFFLSIFASGMFTALLAICILEEHTNRDGGNDFAFWKKKNSGWPVERK